MVVRCANRWGNLGLRWLVRFTVATVVLAGIGLSALTWRLAQGPLELPWLTHELEAVANDTIGPARLSIGGSKLAWEGFKSGIGLPIDIRLSEVTATDAGGNSIVRIPHAEVMLSLGALLVGHVVPTAVDVEVSTVAFAGRKRRGNLGRCKS